MIVVIAALALDATKEDLTLFWTAILTAENLGHRVEVRMDRTELKESRIWQIVAEVETG